MLETSPTIHDQLSELVREIHAAADGRRCARPVLHVCGLNHVRADLALREQYALSTEHCSRMVRRMVQSGLTDQALVLSTCNRTEVYAHGHHPKFASELRGEFLSIGRAGSPPHQPPPIYEHCGGRAVYHLFSVTAGLDSMILGENQIKQQVRQAVEISRAGDACGPELSRLIDAVFRASKRIKTETELNTGTLNVAKAAVLKAERVLGSLAGRVCMVIGAGKIGRIAARAISELGPRRLCIINRTLENAREVAQDLDAEAHGLDALPQLLPQAEFVLGAAYAPELIIDRESYEALHAREGQPARCCMVDAAVPRILDPRLKELPWVDLFDGDQLNEIIEENRQRRQSAAEHAHRLIAEEVEKYHAAHLKPDLAPMIQDLRERFDRLFTNGFPEAAQFAQAHENTLPPDQRRLKQRLLHQAITELKALVE